VGFNVNSFDLITFFQGLRPLFFIKWIFIIILLGYVLFQLVVFRQIKSMERVITQPISSSIVAFVSLAFIATSVILIVIVWSIRI